MDERKLYLGIPISGQVKTRLTQTVARWGDLPVYWERPENLFVPVLFLGFVTDENAVWMAEAASEVCSKIEPFDITFLSITTAPEDGPAKSLRLVGEESEPLLTLRNALERELSGKTVDGKRFRPYVTLAKVKRQEFSALKQEKHAIFPQPVSVSEPVSSIILYESIGAGAKRQYLTMDEFPLG
ncbi:MAG: RNA 2',3'-cyclic phosphodiesterase [Candidatus Moraniibacteriota bacterium]